MQKFVDDTFDCASFDGVDVDADVGGRVFNDVPTNVCNLTQFLELDLRVRLQE